MLTIEWDVSLGTRIAEPQTHAAMLHEIGKLTDEESWHELERQILDNYCGIVSGEYVPQDVIAAACEGGTLPAGVEEALVSKLEEIGVLK